MVRYMKHCHLVAFGFHQVKLKVIIEINGIEGRTHKKKLYYYSQLMSDKGTVTVMGKG